jgi:hypothetical protein
MYVQGFEAVDLENSASSTAVYWCVQTMTPVGPDDDQVIPDRCIPGRNCYEERE